MILDSCLLFWATLKCLVRTLAKEIALVVQSKETETLIGLPIKLLQCMLFLVCVLYRLQAYIFYFFAINKFLVLATHVAYTCMLVCILLYYLYSLLKLISK